MKSQQSGCDMLNISSMIDDCLNDCMLLDMLKNNEPVTHEQAYASYHIEVESDPRTWFVDA